MAKRNKSQSPAKSAVADPPSRHERLRAPPLLCLLLAAVTFVVYLPALRNDFVNYDDSDYVTANPHVQSGLTWANIRWAFTTGHASNWHPITWLSHMLDCQLFGQNAAMHHLVSVFFHVANTLLLFLLLNGTTGYVWRSVIVATLFALHPLHVESVAWASERKDVLSAFFFLLTLIAYSLRFRSRIAHPSSVALLANEDHASRFPSLSFFPSSIQHRASRIRSVFLTHHALYYFVALLLFILGLMSKPMLVTVPFVLLLLDFWPLQRFQLAPVGSPKSKAAGDSRAPKPRGPNGVQESAPASWRAAVLCRFNRMSLQLVLEKIPFFALSITSSVITFKVQQKGGAVSTTISFGARVANAVVSYVHYILDLFWPNHLSVLYPHPGAWPTSQVAASAIFLLIVTAAVLFSVRKHPYLPFGWFWFIGMLVPAIGFIQVGIQSRADRYTYLPLIGLFVMLAWGVAEFIQHFSRSEFERNSAQPASTMKQKSVEVSSGDRLSNGPGIALLTGATILCLLICAIVTCRQITYWRNSETLFRRAVQVTQKNYLAYNNLGFYLSNRGEVAEAITNYRKSLEINPAYEDAHNNLGYAYANQKKYPEAIAEYEAALRIRPNHPEMHNNLGNALADIGRVDEAIAHYLITLQQKPEHADAHNNLGVALSMNGRYAEAIEHFHAALRYEPREASAHSNLGNAYAVQGKFDLAIPEYQQALQLNPKDSQAHNNLANCLSSQGKLDEAIAQYNAALALKPQDPEIHFNLGMALARQGKRQEALVHYTEAIRLKPDYPEAQSQLRALSGPPLQ